MRATVRPDWVDAGVDPARVQGLLGYGYGKLPEARFLLLTIDDAGGAREWLRELLDAGGEAGWIETAREAAIGPPGAESRVEGVSRSPSPRPKGSVGNIAFTWEGLVAMGLDPDRWTGFSRPFRQGMTDRSRWLGDRGRNAVENWEWAAPDPDEGGSPIHAILLAYGETPDAFEAALTELVRHMEDRGVRQTRALETRLLPLETPGGLRFYEHFGFKDGLAQPRISFDGSGGEDEAGRPPPFHHGVAPGEFLLGRTNEWGRESVMPEPLADGGWPVGAGPPETFGRDGSYLVVRQLSQKPVALWRWLRSLSKDPEERLWYAAKMMGRWPGGTPVGPEREPPGSGEGAGDETFDFHDDPAGFGCPIGAHMRRANPRGGTLSDDPELARRMARRHRLLRRGRTYGPPLTLPDRDSGAARKDPIPALDRILALPDDEFEAWIASEPHADRERGLHFLCLNASLERQFEFVTKNWLMNPRFGDLYNDPDPVLGQPLVGNRKTYLTIPDRPVRRRVEVARWFVTVRGGGYFFFPSIPALEYLSRAPETF